MTEERMEASLDNWRCHLLRLTLFPVAADALKALDARWEWLFPSQLPESTEERHFEGVRIQSANRDDALTVRLQVYPGRVDVMALARDAEIRPFSDFPRFAGARVAWLEAIEPWLQRPPFRCARVAIGTQVVEPAQSRIDGYQRLQRLLPSVTLDIEQSSDFLYQINRPRPSTSHSKLVLNRISKWSVAQKLLTLNPTLFAGQVEPVSREYGVWLEVDVNTQINADIEVEDLRAVSSELLDHVMTIAAQGDLP